MAAAAAPGQHGEAEGVLDGLAEGQGVSDGGVAADAFGQLDPLFGAAP